MLTLDNKYDIGDKVKHLCLQIPVNGTVKGIRSMTTEKGTEITYTVFCDAIQDYLTPSESLLVEMNGPNSGQYVVGTELTREQYNKLPD